MIWMLGLGASAGACVRYFFTNLIKKHAKSNFPYATLFLNVSGAFLLGLVVGIKLNSTAYAVIGTGFLGGYTTFSTFNTELFTLLDNHNYSAALAYGGLSYLIGISCAFLGLMVGQHIIA